MIIPKSLRLDFEEYCKDCTQIDIETECSSYIADNEPWNECVIYCKNSRLCQHFMNHVTKEESK